MSLDDVEPDTESTEASSELEPGMEPDDRNIDLASCLVAVGRSDCDPVSFVQVATDDLVVENCPTAMELECADSELVIESGNADVVIGLEENIGTNKFYGKRKISKPSRYAF